MPQSPAVPGSATFGPIDNGKAAHFFKTLSAQNRYAILYRLQTIKRPETRRQRILEFVKMLNEGRTFHPAKTS